jgi:hypothetical protein
LKTPTYGRLRLACESSIKTTIRPHSPQLDGSFKVRSPEAAEPTLTSMFLRPQHRGIRSLDEYLFG